MRISPLLLALLALAGIGGSVALAAPKTQPALSLRGTPSPSAAAFFNGSFRPTSWEDSYSWGEMTAPTSGPPHIYGTAPNGCIAGAKQLPPQGRGYQAIRLSRNRTWGTPQLVGFIQQLGAKAATAGFNPILVGDMGLPRGGRMPSGHASHQAGLDVDIWLRLDLPAMPAAQRESLQELPMVTDRPYLAITPNFTAQQAQLIRMAAESPGVERLFVSAGMKRAMCQSAGSDRAWLQKVRPWYEHTGHMHVRLTCPEGQPDCSSGAPLPPGDGCGADLARWLVPPKPQPEPPPAAAPKSFAVPMMPAACADVMMAR